MSTPAPTNKQASAGRQSMDALGAILSRRSIRAFTESPVSDADLETILSAVQQAPSAANRQPLHFVVVRDPEQKRRLAAAAANQHWLAQADLIFVAVGFPAQSQRWYLLDVAIAMQNMVIAATALGYGTCWIGAFSEEAIRQVVGLPPEARVVALSPIGTPAESPDARPRKSLDQIFSYERYGLGPKAVR
jgi:nitroreductase